MSDEISPPSRGLISHPAVQTVNADALLNTLVELTAAQANIGHALSQICVPLSRSTDPDLRDAARTAADDLAEVARRIDAALEQLKAFRKDIK